LTEKNSFRRVKMSKLVEMPVTSFKHDRDAKECDVCGKGFTMTRRRHHCRGCRAAVCSSCSPNKIEVPDPEWKGPQRVCGGCFDEYSKPGGGDRSPMTPHIDEGGRSPGGSAVPWTGCIVHFRPDRDEKACPSCKKGFSVTRRRHHCRVCGGVFCGPCSKDRRVIYPEEVPGWGGQQRVCTGCTAWVEPSEESELTAAQFCVVHKDTPVFADGEAGVPPTADERESGGVDTLAKGSMVEILSPLSFDYLGVSWCRVRGGWVAPGGIVENRSFQLLQMSPGPDTHLVQILGGDNIRKAQQYQLEVRALLSTAPSPAFLISRTSFACRRLFACRWMSTRLLLLEVG
jgi:hypothetical protein